MKHKIVRAAVHALCASILALPAGIALAHDHDPDHAVEHVLLVSVDGLHQVDLAKWIAANPNSTLASLSTHGVIYTAAHTTTPSDSFPGMLALVTGATPKTTGIYYDDSYDRTYFAPQSGCTGAPGIEMLFDESIEVDDTQLFSPINPANLPMHRTKDGSCYSVYPHEAVHANTVFEVIKAHGGRTAWSDKHPAYDLLNGPSGEGIEDLYTPEVNSLIANGGTANGVNLAATLPKCNGSNSLPVAKVSDYTTCIPAIEAYDDTHVQAALNWIDGLHSDGSAGHGVPTIFGFNLQQVSVTEKLPVGGYVDAAGTPSANLNAVLGHVDQSFGRIVAELKKQHLDRHTLIIITAKHGQSPIDRSTLAMEAGGSGNATVQDPSSYIAQVDPTVDSPSSFTNPNSGGVLSTSGHLQTDDVGLVWLQNESKTNIANVTAALKANADAEFANTLPPGTIFSTSITGGAALAPIYGDPTDTDDQVAHARAPDIYIQPNAGTIYSGSSSKIAEHGGGTMADTGVALLVSMPGMEPKRISKPVSTKQVAPTILVALGLDPHELRGVRVEHTEALPGLFDQDDQ